MGLWGGDFVACSDKMRGWEVFALLIFSKTNKANTCSTYFFCGIATEKIQKKSLKISAAALLIGIHQSA